jgi:DNA-directed RNA polymerase subunit RPC12/RpoP
MAVIINQDNPEQFVSVNENYRCPDCGAQMLATSEDNDPRVTDRTVCVCTDCGNKHIVYK